MGFRDIPPANCPCQGCLGLRDRYKSDPDLLAFYRSKLLLRGWAGNADDVEKLYQQSHAPWAKLAQERGRLLAQSFPGRMQERLRRERFPVEGEAVAAEAEEVATRRPDVGGTAVSKPVQLALVERSA